MTVFGITTIAIVILFTSHRFAYHRGYCDGMVKIAGKVNKWCGIDFGNNEPDRTVYMLVCRTCQSEITEESQSSFWCSDECRERDAEVERWKDT